MPLSAALNDPKIALNGTPVKPVAVISEKEKNVPDQEKPELVVRQRIFSYATYISASPRNTLHS